MEFPSGNRFIKNHKGLKKLTEKEKEELIIKELTLLDNLLELLYRKENGQRVSANPENRNDPYENRSFDILSDDGMATKSPILPIYNITPKGRIKFLKGGYLGEYNQLQTQENLERKHKKFINNASIAAIIVMGIAAIDLLFKTIDFFMVYCRCE